MEARLAAIMAADIVGYTRLMGRDQDGTLRALMAFRSDIFGPTVAAHQGVIVKNMGDGWLVEFASAGQAVACALAVQEQLQGHGALKLRIGVNLGDIVREQEDIFGDGVNVAARLQEIAVPGGIALSGAVHDSLDGTLSGTFADAGLQDLKNVARPVHVWMSGAAGAVQRPAGPEDALALCRIVLRPATVEPGHQLEELAAGLREDLARLIGASEWLMPVRGSEGPADAYALEMQMRSRAGKLRLDVTLETPGGEPIWTRAYDGNADDSFDWQEQTGQDLSAGIVGRVLDAELSRLWDMGDEVSSAERMKQGLFDLLEGSGPALSDAMAGFAEAARQGDVAASVYALRAGAAAAVLDLEQPAPEGVATWCATLKEAALADLVPIYEAILRPDVDPKPPPTGYVEADRLCFGGWAEIRQGRADAGISRLRRFLRQCTRHPLTAVAQCGLAIGLVEAGQDYGAIEQAQTVLRATTGYAVPYRALASAYAHLGRMAEAEEAAKRALRLRRGDTVAELRARSGFAQGPETERYFEGLARAGYPHT